MTINVTITSPDGSEFDIANYLFNATITAELSAKVGDGMKG